MLVSVLLCGVALLGACTKEARTLGEPGEPGAVDRTIDVTAEEFRFDPEEIEVEVGETIEFVLANEGQAQHEFSLGSAHHHDDSSGGHMHGPSTGSTGPIEPGEEGSFVWTFTEAGETTFACYVAGHNEQGMTGTLTVSE